MIIILLKTIINWPNRSKNLSNRMQIAVNLTCYTWPVKEHRNVSSRNQIHRVERGENGKANSQSSDNGNFLKTFSAHLSVLTYKNEFNYDKIKMKD